MSATTELIGSNQSEVEEDIIQHYLEGALSPKTVSEIGEALCKCYFADQEDEKTAA